MMIILSDTNTIRAASPLTAPLVPIILMSLASADTVGFCFYMRSAESKSTTARAILAVIEVFARMRAAKSGSSVAVATPSGTPHWTCPPQRRRRNRNICSGAARTPSG